MFSAPNQLFGVLFAVVLCRGYQVGKPVLSPPQSDIYINEGDDLELTCTSSNKVEFYYPEDVGITISTSPAHLEDYDLGTAWKVIFRRTDTVHGDTGWYGCADEGIQVNTDVHDQPNVSWTYVWVKSNSSYFVQSDALESIRVSVGGTAVIPCRPTSPTYNVMFFSDHDTKIELGTHATYDPKRGFKLQDVALKSSGYYKCQIEDSAGNSQELNYHLNVLKRQVLKNPTILSQALRYVTRGQTLRVNCTIIVESDLQYVINWTTPQQDTRIFQKQYREPFRKNLQLATCELIINRISDNDEGEYECTVATFSDVKKVKTYITVHDPDLKYINLTSFDKDTYYEVRYGDRVQWMAHIDAYPQPTLKWLNPKGEEIVGSWINPEKSKYAVNISSSVAILRINRLDLSDMGLYSLQATNADRIKTLNFTLEVLAKPIPMLEKVKAFYIPKQIENFRCEVAAFPAPNVSWSFTKTPNYPSSEGSEVAPLKSGEIISKGTFLSETSMEIEMPGYLTCTACNRLGCDSDVTVILVSDVSGGFGIMEENPQTIGDDVVRTCAASVYNYTGVEWLDEEDNPIIETEKISIYKTRTAFTHQSILKISNISKSENNSYFVCSAKNDEGSIERYDYKLEILEPVAPYIIETNMNKTEAVFDLTTEGHKTVILKCYVEGIPEPEVTWYKDDVQIKPNDQYMCLHRKQEMHIKYLLDENSGKYTCRASNRFGKDENFLIIVTKAKEVSRPLIYSLVVLVIICVILMIYFPIRMHHEKLIRKQLMEAGLTHFEEGALECLNPDLTVDDQAELLPYDKKWEFPREKLKFGKQLGFGAFGVVMKADAHGICDGEAVTTVAVKMVRRSTEPTYIRALASELKIMVHLGKHLNVVNLLGACTKNIAKRELLVIVEYCRFGNLHNYLLRHRAEFINQIDPTTDKFDPSIGLELLTRTTSVGSNNSASTVSYNNNPNPKLLTYPSVTDSLSISTSPDGCILSNDSTQPGWRSNYHGDYKDQNLKPISTQDLLSWAFQVARGMEYLSQRKVLHGDLAARNILLAENNVVKICDFGLAKTMYKDDNYKKKGDAPLPIKWMAIESIRDRVFSTQSDIWSFGIVLWEFFTLAKTPYPSMEAEKQYQRLIEGYRMEKPEYATNQVYDIMLQCWKAKPSLRPTFTSLVDSIGDLLQESVKEHYVDLNAPYLDMNTTILESGKNDYLTMMSAPDHNILCSQNRDYVNSKNETSSFKQDESYLPMMHSTEKPDLNIFSPRLKEKDEFEFRTGSSAGNNDTESESEAIELSPMLGHEEDPYLKPIDVRERRAEFVKQCHAINNANKIRKNDKIQSGYCNAPLNIGTERSKDTELSDHDVSRCRNDDTNDQAKDSNSYVPSIIRTVDNYVNMPKQKIDLRKDSATSFSNPSYISIDNNH